MKVVLLEERLEKLGLPKGWLQHILPDLQLLAEYKYDSYEMFSPLERFLERLYLWVKQFDVDDRSRAVEFIWSHLVFISQDEMQDLARFLYYDRILPEILQFSIRQEGLSEFALIDAYKKYFRKYLRRSLFIGLSDSSKIDYFRRHNIPISNEQVLADYRSDSSACVEELQTETGDSEAKFHLVFLIDDLNASGYTLIREADDHLEGKLVRLSEHQEPILRDASNVFLCHYISTSAAEQHVNRLVNRIEILRGKFRILLAMTLPDSICVTPENVPARDVLRSHAIRLCEKYYDNAWEDDGTLKGGGIKFGFGRIGLPLVLYSNCPNNSLCILWIDQKYGPQGCKFNALFPRISRHGRWYGRET